MLLRTCAASTCNCQQRIEEESERRRLNRNGRDGIVGSGDGMAGRDDGSDGRRAPFKSDGTAMDKDDRWDDRWGGNGDSGGEGRKMLSRMLSQFTDNYVNPASCYSSDAEQGERRRTHDIVQGNFGSDEADGGPLVAVEPLGEELLP